MWRMQANPLTGKGFGELQEMEGNYKQEELFD